MSNSAPFTILEIRTNDGLSLRSWQSKGDPEKKTFIFFHGNAGNAADRMPTMEVLLQAGHSVVLAEYRGYGGNPGKPSEDKLIMDARLLMDEIIKQGVNEQDIILMGRSLGTGVATFLATEYDVAALILISAYSSLPEIAAEYYPFFPVSLLMRDRFNNLDRIKNITAPLLIFHGEMDRIIPLLYGLKVYDAAQVKKEFIRLPGLGHNNLDMDQINLHVLKKLRLWAQAS
ncbi:Bem46 protein [hydrothermal vent metagenome]|uniref:Bem46 protein n=1 Tax=hydrothermal vent metagenome TaxID=652676 RepID=A0A3B1BHM9_9ZZZZ